MRTAPCDRSIGDEDDELRRRVAQSTNAATPVGGATKVEKKVMQDDRFADKVVGMQVQLDTQDAVDRHRYVKLQGKWPEDICGDPTHLVGEWLLLRPDSEFQFDGFLLVRFADIEATLYGDTEKFFESILSQEGAYSSSREFDALTNAEQLQDLLNTVRASGMHASIESYREEDEFFFVGEITGIDDDCLSIRTYDVLGQWERESTTVHYDDIDQIAFGNRYLTTFSKYVGRM